MTQFSSVCLTLPDADATTRLGAWFASRLRIGDVILLEGPIGAGKTHFARAFIQARLAEAGQMEDVPSPTFTLVQVYETALAEIWHADLYRLNHPDDAAELGLEEAFDTAICLVEWPERLGDLQPTNALRLTFSVTKNGEARRVVLSGGARWAGILAMLGMNHA